MLCKHTFIRRKQTLGHNTKTCFSIPLDFGIDCISYKHYTQNQVNPTTVGSFEALGTGLLADLLGYFICFNENAFDITSTTLVDDHFRDIAGPVHPYALFLQHAIKSTCKPA